MPVPSPVRPTGVPYTEEKAKQDQMMNEMSAAASLLNSCDQKYTKRDPLVEEGDFGVPNLNFITVISIKSVSTTKSLIGKNG